MKKKMKAFLKKFLFTKSENFDIQYLVGNYKIWLPNSHKLPEYQSAFRNYDKKLKTILPSITKFDNRDTIIDIGANVGDTASLIRSISSAKIICIEGDIYYLNYLIKNSYLIPDIIIADTFISGRSENLFGEIIRQNGTTKISIMNNNSAQNSLIKTKTLQQILNETNIRFNSIQLIKIDTDGFDFDILLGNKELIMQFKPNLYFEYDIDFNKNDYNDSLEVITFLESAGYSFIIYDNFGNLLQFVSNKCEAHFIQLNHYLKSTRAYGGGIFYFDVFATSNLSIAEDIIKNEDR